MPGQLNHFGVVEREPFSCRNIFQGFPLVREISLTVYIHFHLQKSRLQEVILYPYSNLKDNFKEPGDGRFHLLHVTHKFPVLQKV